jgi:RNA polymerase sigma-70 factor (ECF subfamily)
MTGNSSDAEDLCQEVFITAYRKIDSFEERASISTWLYRVAINRSKDFLRKRKRTPEILVEDESPAELARGAEAPALGDPESAAFSSEAERILQSAIVKLPVNLRMPLVLHELEGLEYSEIARSLRLPVGTVKSRIFRARVQLAEILEPHREQWVK